MCIIERLSLLLGILKALLELGYVRQDIQNLREALSPATYL